VLAGSVLVFFDPTVEVTPIQVNATTHAHNWQFPREYQVLNRLLAPAQIDSGFLDVQEGWLHLMHCGAGYFPPEHERDFDRHCLY
jgi:hypothetical protein